MTDDIVERLRKVEPDALGERTRWMRNPDGPEAADEIERLREALKEFMAYACPLCDGLCDEYSNTDPNCPKRMGRAALAKGDAK